MTEAPAAAEALLEGNRQELPPPPINSSSSLMAVQPLAQHAADISMTQPATFDVQSLQLSLTRSQQQAGSSTGLRRAVSAPHSIDSLVPNEPEYLPPSGGPMRRVHSSLGMRRSSSFFWTPTAHHDFERAIGALNARGAEISPATIMPLMGFHTDLKMSDIERHLKKKQLVQRRVLQQLSSSQTASPLDYSTGSSSQPTSPSMAAVAEEPAGPAAGGGLPVQAQRVPSSLLDQLDRQKAEHRQMAAMRQQMLAAADGAAIAATGT